MTDSLDKPYEALWELCRSAFTPNGSLRDIYIENTALADWDTLLSFLRAGSYPFQITFDEEGNKPFATAAEIFAPDRECWSLLSIQLQSVVINCHFFAQDEIEMDIDPKEVSDQESFAQLLDFLKRIGEVLQRDILLADESFTYGNPEARNEVVFLRYELADHQFHYYPHGLNE